MTNSVDINRLSWGCVHFRWFNEWIIVATGVDTRVIALHSDIPRYQVMYVVSITLRTRLQSISVFSSVDVSTPCHVSQKIWPWRTAMNSTGIGALTMIYMNLFSGAWSSPGILKTLQNEVCHRFGTYHWLLIAFALSHGIIQNSHQDIRRIFVTGTHFCYQRLRKIRIWVSYHARCFLTR